MNEEVYMSQTEDLIDADFENVSLLEELYQKYLTDPNSIDPSWYPYFDHIESSISPTHFPHIDKSAPADLRIYHLIESYRIYGHLLSNINPLETQPPEEPWQLRLDKLGFDASELNQNFPTNGLLMVPEAPLQEIISILREIYCANVGVEYMGLGNPKLEEWLQKQIEPTRFRFKIDIESKKMILQYLNKSELFEVFLHTKYVGQKRFSLEGAETLIPIMASIIDRGSVLGIEDFVLGMAHRGRLNVLSNIMDKSYATIFAEFENHYIPVSFEGSGDVKYHKGFTSTTETVHGKKVSIFLSPNPSHLESVDPVVEGIVRAKLVKKNDLEKKEKVLPIAVHGDAALSGQGVVYETMQMYNLEGYSTGGTIHLVINNQIGFTTFPKDGRSTRYCTDIAKAFGAPVFHVNAEDPESCFFVTQLAVEIRQKFHCDVFIDLVCYRKYGHNEGDEPAFTQPIEYKIIREKRPIREMYRDHLIQQGVLEKEMAESLEQEFKESLQRELNENKSFAPPAVNVNNQSVQEEPLIKTGTTKEILLEVAQKFTHIPEGFSLHPKLAKLVKEHLEMIESDKPIDWGMAETLAYATLVNEGVHVRISGQDSCRGTFSHRHAIWMDQKKEMAYFPLKHIKPDQGRFDIYNSHLSEFAVLGFEYGYSLAYLDALVIWEAQFGDFANGAQVVIDQYISSAEQKWNQKNGITLLLPHGYEGQGPEHSSARMERFLSLCGNDNMRVVNPSTPSQMFHILRNQAKNPMHRPLVIFTPKALLRLHECVSSVEDLTNGTFIEIYPEPNPPKNPKRLAFCTGKIYYDLRAEREKRKAEDLVIIRIEQLYPLNTEKLKEIVSQYNGIEIYYWVQEEPQNMGAWTFIESKLKPFAPNLQYIGRDVSASTAAGSHALHKKQQDQIIEALFARQTS
jgi:2-oxoglutarate dehydrogenase E1 component